EWSGAPADQTDHSRPAPPPQRQARPNTSTSISGLPWSQIRLQGGGQQLLGVLARIAAPLTAELHPPAEHPGARGRGGRAGCAGGVTARQERLMSFDDLLGDGRASLGGQRALAVEVAGLVPREGDVDHHWRRTGADIRPRAARQHVLADRPAVWPNDVVG